ncbi:MAG TPA: hypothetical protein PKK06_03920 [Phycisphaerae bacterium]|nr:hypothetical protein [Phycisphaerae bacterium]HNU44911.1 hypothetical protein [Phycisphaerae bacterium]
MAVTAALSIPFGWLLSYAAALPFYLGLFFFVLFGLLIGALAYRLAHPGCPYAASALVAGTTLIVLACWGTSLYKEAADLPHDLASRAVRQTGNLGERTSADYQADVARQVRAYLRAHYRPGGTLGYLRWVATSGVIPAEALSDFPRELSVGQRRASWMVRVVLSLTLLSFGVGSQTLVLREPQT